MLLQSSLGSDFGVECADPRGDPAGEALYPGADNTEIAPTTMFDRAPIYQAFNS